MTLDERLMVSNVILAYQSVLSRMQSQESLVYNQAKLKSLLKVEKHLQMADSFERLFDTFV